MFSFSGKGRKSIIILVIAAFLLGFASSGIACVGKTLIIGALDNPYERLMAQMMAVIINERTGTTVNVEFFDGEKQLFDAIEKREVNIYMENTDRAMQQLGMDLKDDQETIYSVVKEAYKKQLHLVLLEPFGPSPTGDGSATYVPVIAEGILIEYPALPRVLNKLAGIAEEKNYSRLITAVESGDKPSQVARDFLKKKRFI